MNSEAIDYFFAEFDYLLGNGMNPREALLETAEDYAVVFFNNKLNIKAKEDEVKFDKVYNYIFDNIIKKYKEDIKKIYKYNYN